MKYVLLLALFVVLNFPVRAQNMVPNGDFEYRLNCPPAISALTNYCLGWYAYTGGTSDYFNACSGTGAGVPTNQLGTQAAADGHAYAGLITYDAGSFSYKEYIATTISPLVQGKTYEVSMSVSLADNVTYAANDISVLFTINRPINQSSSAIIVATPQVTYSNYGIITDKINWTRLVKNFYADSAYSRIIIGSFMPTGIISTSQVGGSGYSLAYYYIDSVVIQLYSKIKISYSDTALCAGDTFTVSYTLDTGFTASAGNQFKVQLSDANGNFASPNVIGTVTSGINGSIFCTIPTTIPQGNGYRIRVISTSPADTSAIGLKKINIGNNISKPVATGSNQLCPGENIYLSAFSTTPGVNWNWTGPDNFNSTQQNPIIANSTVANTGNYILTSNLYGCIAKDTITVTVIPIPPSGLFANGNSPLCANDTVKLFAATAPTGAVYNWTGPNSFTSSVQNPIIINPILSASGDYIVSISYNGCIAKDTVSVIVLPSPTFSVIASSNSPVCDGGMFTMNASASVSGATYNWSGPYGFTALGANASFANITMVNAGNYIVTGTYNYCHVKDTITLIINPLPSQPVAGSNTPVCSGNTLNLTTSTSTSGVAYSWTGPGSFTSSAQNPSRTNVTTVAAGDYIVTATITATGCSARDTETVVVRPTPVVNATNNTPVCEGATVNLFSSATPTGTSSWSGPNSYTSSAQNPTISNASPAASGDYIVSVTLNGCTGKDTTTVIVKPNPITPLTNSNTPVCVGMNLNLTAASNSGASYSWTGPNSFGSAVQNPIRTNIGLSDAGAYSVIATLNGCVSPAGSTTVVVNPLPFVTIYPTPSDSICQGSPVTFVALPANTSTPSYKWTKNSSPSVLGTGSALTSSTINNNDIIRCEMTETTKCGTAFKDTSNEVKMTVLPWLTPSVSISSNPTTPLSPYELITFTAIPVNAGNNPKYQWQRNSSDVIGATSSTWATQQLSNNDSISVILTSYYRCPQPKTAGSNKIKVIVLTGVGEVKGNNTISLYPNPNNGSFTIKGNVNSNKEVTIQIVNAVGQLVYESRTLPKNKELDEQVNVQHLASGTYLLKIKTEPITNIKFKIE